MSERVHCSLAQATLRGPCTAVVTGHHSGRRKAKAPGLKKVPDRHLGESRVREYSAEYLAPIPLPESKVRTPGSGE
eukprot:2386513-Rhodomonas_salina.1